jgi:predicted esterase
VDEIARDLTIHTLDRMADYLRLADDPALAPQQKLSLAISGWLLGSGSAVENLAVTKSLIRVRDIVRRYLASNRKPERDALLDELTSQEGASPAYVAKLIAHMKPPLPAGPDAVAPADVANPAALLDLPTGGSDKPAGAPSPKPDARTVAPPPGDGCEPNLPAAESTPATAAPKAPPAATLAQPAALPAVPAPAPGPEPSAPPAAPQPLGLHELAVKGVPEEPEFKYWLQLPPEYDPYRRYPCIVTLNGAGTTPLQQIDWWAGSYVPEMQTRYGQASRHGYIVLAPRWTREYQRRYEFSAREWAAVLYTLQDACKRFAIDTDRVFLSGHSMGGDAVWDMGLSHPSLWAGVIPIVATADKYVARYWRNGKYVPMYFVSGEKDGGRWAQNSTEWDRYLTYTGFDTTVVQYQGRGHEHFHDEIQNLFAWMNLHKRNFFPREIDMDTLRPWDNFFWWVEVRDPQDTTVILPAEWGSGSKSAKSARPAQIEARVLETNTLTVRAGAHRRVAVWLSPDIVSFEGKSPTVRINNKPQSKIQPSLPVLLEDVRLRGDRQHPFWAKVEN